MLGYEGEPYLRFDAGGGVWENRRSPAVYENAQRFGVGQLPADGRRQGGAAVEPRLRRRGRTSGTTTASTG